MTTARDLVDAIASGKSATIQATFDALMTEKIQGGIEAYRQAVIDNTFNPELVSESEEVDSISEASEHYAKMSEFAKKTTDGMKPGETKYVGRYSYNPGKSEALETHAKKDSKGNITFHHKNGIKGKMFSAANYEKKLTNESEELDEGIAKTIAGKLGTVFGTVAPKKAKAMIDADKKAQDAKKAAYDADAEALLKTAREGMRKARNESEEFDLSEFTLEEIQDFMKSENFTALDELSKSTLANYYSKAIGDRHSKDLARDSANRKGDEDSAKKLGDKVSNRSSGLEKAKAKFFAKDESEEVSELSKKTLSSYVKNAAISAVVGKEKAGANSNEVGRHLDKGDIESAAKFAKKTNDLNRKVGKRIVGISKASDRLAKD